MNRFFSATRPFFALICCAVLLCSTSCNEECGEPDVDAINSLYLQFNMDGSSEAFSPEDLDSVYIVRYGDIERDSFLFPIDTLNLFMESEFSLDGKLIIGRETPRFATSGPPYYTDFQYLFRSYGDNWQVRLQDIHLVGSYTDDEQCDYENLSKTFFLNEDSIDATASTTYVLMNKD